MLPPTPQSVQWVRDRLRRSLQQYDAGVRETAVFIAEELAANAIRHARTQFDVDLEVREGSVRITVTDADPRPPRIRAVEPLAEDGRGLIIVAALAQGWGVDLLPNGKRVWAELDTT